MNYSGVSLIVMFIELGAGLRLDCRSTPYVMEDESAPLLKGRTTPLFGVNTGKWQSSNEHHGAVNNKPPAIINVSSIECTM